MRRVDEGDEAGVSCPGDRAATGPGPAMSKNDKA